MGKPLRSIADLAAAKLIPAASMAALERVAERYAVAISPELVSLIDRSDPADPIARQFLPTARELTLTPEERDDPIGDARHSPVAGVVHRHRDRVLLKAVATCPVYCRFCFRRETVGPAKGDALSTKELEDALAYIAAHREIWEVIVTGGDPFMLSARRVRELSARISATGHVKVLRWHTRVPMVDPLRVSPVLVEALKSGGPVTWVAIHANHPREFSTPARAAIARLSDAGIPLVSQSVLLKGVNDDIDTLEALLRCFVESRIKPYYLHHPDLAPGTSHFRIAIDDGLALTKALRSRVSGLAMPTYVLDIPSGYAKVPLESRDAERLDEGRWRVRDHDGAWHLLPPK